MLESDTAEVDNHKVVRAFYADRSQGRRRKSDWPKERGEYCHFVLYKENKDTMQAINLLAKFLKIKPDRFAFAGTKDGRAITVQCVSVFRIDARNLLGLNKVLNNIHVGNFEFKKTPLKLGDLKGNRFVVVLRDIDATEQLITTSMTSLNSLGFINYYGLQRFGTMKNATQAIGLCLLQSKWSEAIDLILGSRCEQDDVLCKAYEHWIKTRNAKESLHMFQGKKCLETFLLEGLVKFGNDLVSAVKVLPRNTRLMYVHAYQSYIWNVAVSKRIQELGLKVAIGDLVFNETESTSLLDEHVSSEPVKFVTSEDINLYTIHDVIMPLPGYDVIYPDHSVKACYEELLSHDNLDIKNMRHKVKDYSLSGAYRHMVVKPESLSWEITCYDDPTVSLVETDYDRMMGVTKPAVSCSDGKYKALRMEFTLPSSSYATMLVREILKTDTSPSYHSSLNRH
ncbi:pseudouridylate synthase 7 homolog [Dendronephthya gigantea]|uniref:pseudouridylate synthase 7 homolog n=1 Tax=Dendronephthya gigantea TaxID=151771 RepID=UPI0010698040|nr:pseudouridylate synthase 7 homolog [Dendronephthya gigantea]